MPLLPVVYDLRRKLAWQGQGTKETVKQKAFLFSHSWGRLDATSGSLKAQVIKLKRPFCQTGKPGLADNNKTTACLTGGALG